MCGISSRGLPQTQPGPFTPSIVRLQPDRLAITAHLFVKIGSTERAFKILLGGQLLLRDRKSPVGGCLLNYCGLAGGIGEWMKNGIERNTQVFLAHSDHCFLKKLCRDALGVVTFECL